LFSIIGWCLIALGTDLREAREVSMLIRLPYYIIVYGMGVCFSLVCLVLFCDLVRTLGGKYE
jgi:hypothetical protein